MMIEVIRERWTVAPRDTVGLDSLEIDWRFPAPGPLLRPLCLITNQ